MKMGEKRLTTSDLTSDSWKDLEGKLEHVTWEGLPLIHAVRAPSGKIVVVSCFETFTFLPITVTVIEHGRENE